MQPGLEQRHGLFHQLHSCLVGRRDEFDHRRAPLPRHGAGLGEDRFGRIQEGAVPVVFDNAPSSVRWGYICCINVVRCCGFLARCRD